MLRALMLSCVALAPVLAFAGDDEALTLAKKAEAHYRGFGGQRADVRMVLKDAAGGEKVYELVELDLETSKGARLLLRFKSPKTHEGTALLVREVPGGEDEVWLYLAATQKLSRLAGNDRMDSFLGSEMDIEQLTFPKTKDYVHKLAGAGTIEGRACHNIEALPKSKAAPYGKVVSCVDKENFSLLELRYFDRAGVPVKVLTAGDHKAYGDKWRPHKLVATNLQTGRSTVIEVSNYKLGLKLSEKLFTSGQLRKH